MEVGKFPLLNAARNGDVDEVKKLVERGVPIDITEVRLILKENSRTIFKNTDFNN